MTPSPGGAPTGRDEVRGGGVLRALERPVLALEAWLDRHLPPALQPIASSGALAAGALLVACVSGVLLLFFYESSVHTARASVAAMADAPLTSGLLRSLHRYSSDATVLFALLHAGRLFLARRFTGARRLAWITGVLAVAGLWAIGWSGYWLVWDARAQRVALGTAKLLDSVPVFAEPFSRAFLADAEVSSLLFFVVFFAHMLLPLALAVPLWLHVARLARPRLLPSRPAWLALGLPMVALSVLLPADLAGPARLATLPPTGPIDAWYLAVFALTDRLPAGPLWGLLAGVALVTLGLPFALQRRRASPAFVEEAKCHSCNTCVTDCPYEAIQLVPRTDGRPYPSRALIDPSVCVGCGICAGSCDSSGIGLPVLPALAVRSRLDERLEKDAAAGRTTRVAFVCAEAARGDGLEAAGWAVEPIPCAGWLHTLTVERALRRGAAEVLVVSCHPGSCAHREGAAHAAERLAGRRVPALRLENLPEGRVHRVEAARGEERSVAAYARSLVDGTPKPTPTPKRPLLVGALAVIGLTAVTAAGSLVPYEGPPAPTELVLSFRLAGARREQCRERTDQELAALPAHMRQRTLCERARGDVTLVVEVDGEERLRRTVTGGGLRGDGAAVALERLPIAPGTHDVTVRLDAGEAPLVATRALALRTGDRAVVRYEPAQGFVWHAPGP